MKAPILTAREGRLIGDLTEHYRQNQDIFNFLLTQMVAAVETPEKLRNQTHSLKARIKDPDHLADKLRRKILTAKKEGKQADYDKENLFTKINDLVGVRLIHLHTRQIEHIHPLMMQSFEDVGFKLIEPPFARTWDDESRSFFAGIGIATQQSKTLYTSVHYTVSTQSKLNLTGEFQVRTLMEEVWGEVDHAINYPSPTESVACREQILALARSTSASTRLVDAIFASKDDFDKFYIRDDGRLFVATDREKRRSKRRKNS